MIEHSPTHAAEVANSLPQHWVLTEPGQPRVGVTRVGHRRKDLLGLHVGLVKGLLGEGDHTRLRSRRDSARMSDKGGEMGGGSGARTRELAADIPLKGIRALIPVIE